MKISKKLFFIVLQLFVIFLFPNFYVSASNNDQLIIRSSPDRELFNLINMAPGDKSTKILKVQNRGMLDFKYNTEVKLIAGSNALYNVLLLKIEDSTGLLFNGNLKDFTGFNKRLLRSMFEEDLKFSIEFPLDKGNEFQGLTNEIEFRFIAEEQIDVIPDPPDNPDPPGNPDPPDNPDPPGNPDPPDNPDPPGNPDPPDNPDPPGNPDPPDNPDPPGNPNPVDPENPKDPVDTDNGEEIKPERPITEEELETDPNEGEILPDTASSMYNFIFIGIVFMSSGVLLLIFQKKRKIRITK